MKLSFVIPVYNAAPFLRECLDFLLAQNAPAGGYEIVAVNDGSTDGSPAILREYAAAHPKLFVVVDQPNAGPGTARNTGFAASCGEFVWFIDADDIVRRGAVLAVVGALEETGAELLRVDYRSFEESEPVPQEAAESADAFDVSPTTPAKELCFSNWTPWDKIFSRELLLRAGLRFPPLLLGDDAAELFRIVAQARKIVRTRTTCYFYRQRRGSLMRVFTERSITDDLRSSEIVEAQIPLFPELREEYEYFHWRILECMIDRCESAVSAPGCDAASKTAIEARLPEIRAKFAAAAKPGNPYIHQIIWMRTGFKRAIEHQAAAFRNSLSWKLTAPVRFLADMLKFKN